jgi:hypothetical protein
MEATGNTEGELDVATIVGLDAYSKDSQFIGRVSGLLPEAHVSEQAIEEGHTDPIGPDGQPIGPRHVLINGTGTVVQSTLIVKLESLDIDLAGRRVTLPLTVVEIEAMPHHDPHARPVP